MAPQSENWAYNETEATPDVDLDGHDSGTSENDRNRRGPGAEGVEGVVRAQQKELDTQLVSVALFSAVLAAFTLVSSAVLRPSKMPSDASVQLLSHISAQLSALAVNDGLTQATPLSTVDYNIQAQSVFPPFGHMNTLWLCSLICSMSAASLCLLAKLWLHQCAIRSPSVSHRSAEKWFRDGAFEKWRVRQVIVLSPILLHAALVLFLAGLLHFLWTLHHTIANFAIAFVAVLGCFLVAAPASQRLRHTVPFRH